MNNLFQLILVCFVCMVSANHTILVVLGCADSNIQQERVNSAMDYINKSNTSIKLYVSGGVKDAILSNKETEASRMAKSFEDKNIEIVLDEKAKNTAENFAYLKRWVNNTFSEDELPSIVITTSDFHQDRAGRIFQGIIPEITPSWNLSKSDCSSCWSDETVHIKNVQSDIMKAIHIIQ